MVISSFRFAVNRRFAVFIKSVSLILVVTSVWLYLRLNNYGYHLLKGNNLLSQIIFLPSKSSVYSLEPNATQKSENQVDSKTLSRLRQTIDGINEEQKVMNLQHFGGLSSNDMVIVVQVHNRAQYLSALIKSLSRTQGIDKVLLVFSHDVFDDEINSIVRRITFCKVSYK